MKKIILFLPLFLFMISCREEIVSPDNPAENINEPVTSTTENSYSFLINADNISYDVLDYTHLRSARTALFFSVSDHESGEVRINILDESSNTLYVNSLDRNIPGSSEFLRGNNPYAVKFKFLNFSGRLNVRITRLD